MILALVLAAILAASVYTAHCLFWPYTACRRCAGSGKHRSPSGHAWRPCRRCNGSGARLRLGRRLYTRIRAGGRRANN